MELEQLLHELFDDDKRLLQTLVPHIPGLIHIPECLSSQQQERLLQQLTASGWLKADPTSITGPDAYLNRHANAAATASASSSGLCKQPQEGRETALDGGKRGRCRTANQVMVFGVDNMPAWLLHLGQQLPVAEHWPKELATRHPLFDTAIINLYYPGDGISPHVDLLRFADGVAVVSLGGPAIMNFSQTEAAAAAAQAQEAGVEGTGVCLQQTDLAFAQTQQQQQQEGDYSSGSRHTVDTTKSDGTAQPGRPETQQQCRCGSVIQNCNSSSCYCRCQQLRETRQMGSSGRCDDNNRSQQPMQLADKGKASWRNRDEEAQTTHCKVKSQQHHLLLQGGDVMLLHGEARYQWQHGIAPAVEELLVCEDCRTRYQHQAAAAGLQQELDAPVAVGVQGVSAREGVHCGCVRVVRGRRVSITLRRLDPTQQVLNMQ